MNLVSLVLALVIVGVALYVIEALIPMNPRIKSIIEVIVCLGVLIYLLQSFGFIGGPVIRMK